MYTYNYVPAGVSSQRARILAFLFLNELCPRSHSKLAEELILQPKSSLTLNQFIIQSVRDEIHPSQMKPI